MTNIIKKSCLLVSCLLFVFSSVSLAAPITTTIAEAVGSTFLQSQDSVERSIFQKRDAQRDAVQDYEGHSISNMNELRNENTGELLAYVFVLQPKGFVVVSPDTDITPIIAYSFEGDFNWEDSADNALLSILKYDMQNRVAAVPLISKDIKDRNYGLWTKYFLEDAGLLNELTESATYGPLLSTAWYQSSPYNSYCPMDPVTGSRTIVGCVATAMAQIVNYHACTTSVTFTSADNFTTSTRGISINASGASMSSISYPASSDTAARLSYACGVSVQMDYTSDSSGAATAKVADALKNKFGFTSATAYAPQSGQGVPVLTTFYDKLKDNIMNGKPAQLAIAKSTGGGHSIVCDGYNSTTGQYHLNYGWGSSSPSPPWWYTLPSGMPAGYDILKYGVLDIKSSCKPSCPDLYSWNGHSYDLAGPLFTGTHSPASEWHQKRRIVAPVKPMGDTLTFMLKEIDGEESYINSAAILFSLKWAPSNKQWMPLPLISATHSTLGDVMEPLREQDETRVHMIPGDEILLRYAIPYQLQMGSSLFEPGPFELEFLGWSSGYYLWRDEMLCEAWSQDAELVLQPGDTVAFEAMINNMTTQDLPADAQVWFVLKDEVGTRIGPASASGLPPATPTWFSFAWQVPEGFTPGTYTYAPRVYVGENDVTWDDLKLGLFSEGSPSMMAEPVTNSGCNP